MESTLTDRGQTVVPAPIRKRFNIRKGDRLVWIEDGETIKVIPVPADAIRALRGISKGENLWEELMKIRNEERARDR